MSVKLTNRRIVTDANFLGALTQKQLPIKVSYAISKNISKIENELKIYNSEKQKLIDKYCDKDEEGQNIIDESNQLKIQSRHLDDWDYDINELLDIEIELDIHKFKLDDLLHGSYEMSPAEMTLIDYMIEE